MDPKSDWTRVCHEEDLWISKRRAWLVQTNKCTCRFPPNSVGLALSGGGIRSATFSLGLMRSLSEHRLIHCIDYLSTVSGGGYAGAFYCSLFIPNDVRGPAPLPPGEPDSADSPNEPEVSDDAIATGGFQENPDCDVLGLKPGRDAIAQLRQGGHYLAPNGTSDALFAGVIAIRNWFALAITMGLALLAIFFFVNFAIAVLDPLLERSATYVSHFRVREDRYGVWQFILIVLALWPAACAWAYWFARSRAVQRSRTMRLISMQTLVALLIFILALVWPAKRDGWHEVLRDSILAISVLSFLIYALAQLVSYLRDRRAGATRKASNRVEALAQEDRVRNRLSRWLLRGTVVFLATAALAGFHWISREQVFRRDVILNVRVDPKLLAIAAIVILVLIIATRSVFRRAGTGFRPTKRRRLVSARTTQLLSLIVGAVLLTAFITFWATMAGGASQWIEAHADKAWENIRVYTGEWLPNVIGAWVDTRSTSPQSAAPLLFIVTVKVAIVAYLIGNVDSLLNRSSFCTFYSGRLRSAYLGATNQRRQRLIENQAQDGGSPDESAVPLDRDDPNDEITLAAYYGRPRAPIHLINVTINETTSSSSRVIQRDRKGKSMTIAPSGYLYPPRSPAEPLALLRRNKAEDLPLSSWMAISGAAFTTGAGHHTSLGTALLATLTNVRLGYWWHRDTQADGWGLRGPTRLVQSYLLRELRASYKGTCDSRWYLSDGGHYENTGTYELIRRRIPFIITSDNGADPYYEFGDLVNLMRKVRIDFSTEIEFLGDPELDALFASSPLRDVFGSLDEIRRSGKQALKAEADPGSRQPKAGPYATLARIRYPGIDGAKASTGTLLLIKPRITGRELPDLVQYRDVNAAFPQQPTTNQFFDEAQWESYYRLGQLIGDMIFKKDRFPQEAGQSHWQPWKLEPLPANMPAR